MSLSAPGRLSFHGDRQCQVGKMDVATEGAGAGAVEVRNRLEELQAKVAALEQDKVRKDRRGVRRSRRVI